MLEDVTVVHKGMLPRRGSIKGYQEFGAVLDESHRETGTKIGGTL